MKMPFGVHKGKEVDSIPRKYLEWLAGQGGLYGKLKDAVEDRLKLLESQEDELTWQEKLGKEKGYSDDDDGEEWRDKYVGHWPHSRTNRYPSTYRGFPNPNELLDQENLDQGLKAMANMSGQLDALDSFFSGALNQGAHEDEEYF